ncbi:MULTISPECIES: P-type DNA transfer protein VirB5 [Brucella]|uniref:P-type DNA transfer protein VirB5 n=1 Tax=Brucella TaxID=234 RepID=UPI0001B47517|nr:MULTISPECIES: P-type DNA transfer protein VirB5 [Brucella]AIJ69220.1 P-type DNA transfer protein VirB5 [Brucella suis bv. 3 str. 686]EEY30751.1 type IV secretion system protein virB5 [Brucella suis bv. 3 str. 686]MXF79134.1 P-type DNA transfer protein VirB5 [Brucella melitensis]QOK62655.1 P-type DNA transfer protein VirB5 [Brucella suis bv. 3]
MKKIILSFAFALTVTSTAHAQLPVTDAGSIAQNLANHLEQMVKFAQQIEQLKQQFEEQKMQFDALTGNRGLGDILRDPTLRSYLPHNWRDLYEAVMSGGYLAAAGETANLLRKSQVYDPCASISDKDQRIACEAKVVKPVQDKVMTSKAYDATDKRLQEIESLMQEINKTGDPKAIAELQGRIESENAMIQNEDTRLHLYQQMAEAQDRLLDERQHELDAKDNARRGYPQPKALEAAY